MRRAKCWTISPGRSQREPKGTLPLKLRLPGCLPIRRLSGTHDRKMRAKLVRMIHALHEQGRDDLVNGIARGTLKPLQVYNRWKFSRLEDLPHADELPASRMSGPGGSRISIAVTITGTPVRATAGGWLPDA